MLQLVSIFIYNFEEIISQALISNSIDLHMNDKSNTKISEWDYGDV